MVYKYLNGSQVYIYPSANSDDGGDVNNEGNLKTLFGSAIDNFVIRDSNGFELNISQSGQIMVFIDSGEAIIDGHYIKTEATAYQSSSSFLNSMGYDISEGSNPHLVIALLKDTTGNARGDLLEVTSGSYVRVAKGVGFTLTNNPDQIPDSIDLGTLTIANGNVTDYEINENAYKYINVSDIKLSETGSVVNPIYINSDGEFERITTTFICDTPGSTADKSLPLPDGISLNVGDIIKIKFTYSNTAQNPQLGSSSIYLSDGRLCPWYAISETSVIYEFVLLGVGGAPRVVLLNPSSPLISASYTYQNTSGDALHLHWRENKGVVSVYAELSGVQGVGSGSSWRSTSRSQLPVPSYYSESLGTTIKSGNFHLPLSTANEIIVSWGSWNVSTDLVQCSFISVASALSSPSYDFTFSYVL